MKIKRLLTFSAYIWSLMLCFQCCPPGETGAHEEIQVTILQLNDVYEMSPVGGQGGLARVATLKKQLIAQNPNTFCVLAGDLVSPSAIGLARIDGKAIAGQQMIESANPFLEVMTFGNHEFDIKEDQLKARIAESQFQWVSSNVYDRQGNSWPGVKENLIREIRQGDLTLKIGIFSLTLDSAKKDFVTYNTDYLGVAQQQVKKLKDQGARVIIALTHLDFMTDTALAQFVPEIDLIMGGHEHENMQILRGNDFTPVTKADANARTAYIHKLVFSTKTNSLTTDSELQIIDERFPDDPETAAIIEKWVARANEAFKNEGIDSAKVVATTTGELDGREAIVRNQENRLTLLIADGMKNAVAGAQAAFYNSGSIRIDDVIPAGQTLTEYDVLRILPFGGNLVMIKVQGSLLVEVLNQGFANRGSGGFLQKSPFSGETGNWLLAGNPIKPELWYQVVVTDFLLTGQEQGLDYLKPPNPRFEVVRTEGDIRQAVIAQLARDFPAQ